MLAAKCTTGAFSNMSAVHTEVCEWLCGGRNSLLAAQARGLEFDFLQLPHFHFSEYHLVKPKLFLAEARCARAF